MLVVTEEKDASVHKAEMSVASIPVQEKKEDVISKSRNGKRKLEDLKPGVNHHKIFHTNKAKSDDKGETIIPGTELEQSWNRKRS